MSLWSRIERRLEELAGDLLPDDFRAGLRAAEAELDVGDARAAAARLEILVASRPDHALARALHGTALLALGEPEAALAEIDRGLERMPDSPEALVARGQVLLALDQPALAIPTLRRAVDAAAGERALLAAAYRGLGEAYGRTGERDKAIRELRKAVAEAPGDVAGLGLLGGALAQSPDGTAEARRLLEKATDDERAAPEGLLELGRLLLADRDLVAARARLERARDAADARGEAGRSLQSAARLRLAEVALAEHEPEAARQLLVAALEREPRSLDAHARLGDALVASADPTAALAAYRRALELTPPDHAPARALLERAIDAARATGALAEGVELANRLLAIAPDAPRALLARGRDLAQRGEHAAARATYLAALERAPREDSAQLHCAMGELELANAPGPDGGSRAAEHALAALRAVPREREARRLLSEARGQELAVDGGANPSTGPEARYPLALAIARLLERRPELVDLAAESRAAADELDQPLLLTVMGEFSSGKSTFINALIGEDVAATGVTPTTSTINVVKYGRERSGRIVGHGGAVETMPLPELARRLAGLDTAAARAIAMVEIRLPLDGLERVSIVDTPGLNSILPEHEEVARGFIARADAVVWLFSAQQAGKASERAALEAVRAQGKRVLGVLNKVDQLAEGERDEAVAYVGKELAELVEAVVPLSARVAATSGGQGGNFPAVLDALERGFFAHAREIKWQAVSRRLAAVLARARAAHADRHAAALVQARAFAVGHAAALAAGEVFVGEQLARERAALAEAGATIFRGAAREVLELVQPRRLPFGSHSATRADRDYLASLLYAGYQRLLGGSLDRVTAQLGEAARQAVAAAGDPDDLRRAIDDGLRLVHAQVYDRCLAYLRGYLDGGYVDSFVRVDLPRLVLAEDAVYHALWRDAPDLDAQVALPLARAGAELFAGLAGRLDAAAAGAEDLAFELEVGLLGALDRLEARRRVQT